ncbi:Endoplasmic reticulum mannosyl-oligosaccharide 1,2-alpha-mannosidase [Lachnellula hyalina]|uniref:alpha-1,2-Mannosidase n=1 Tax=Lachnellula hyalina TaxID=1316788 RepID=A0A8H8U3Y8_9HELO|nr:Endoplasmic reticulum mannosyl-oligosaccharide 1,2-alpha-mannosidase [Lachnellula hyalina]TVY30778.1 Endoplasmic reticulum mannosyl-oligosaccharide 1,2-alpha-mannosidase [Lachnellula hyalina]
MPAIRRSRIAAIVIVFLLSALWYIRHKPGAWSYQYTSYTPALPKAPANDGKVHWIKLPDRYPVSSYISYPTGSPANIPLVQASQPRESAAEKQERIKRKQAVLDSFLHSWEGYKEHAWLRDEVAPISGQSRDTFGGWAASLVDTLDTLWIMGMKDEFELAVHAVEAIDFSTTMEKDINIFETTIRYLGGFLAAYDVSGGQYPVLLAKAVEVGELVMSCFDTPNRMPITRWDWQRYSNGNAQEAPEGSLVSEPGSLSLEFTRLSQLTKDPKYYDAVQRISDVFEEGQNTTKMPVSIHLSKPASGAFSEDNFFTLGGMSDSLYEYFPKQYLIMGGLLEQPRKLYEGFIEVAKEHMFFRIYNPKDQNLTVSGDIQVIGGGNILNRIPNGQHLTCFAGGMVGLASKIFNRPSELTLADELTSGCVWAYDNNPNGIAPEIFSVMPCPKNLDCKWSQERWHRSLAVFHPLAGGILEDDGSLSERVSKIAKENRLAPGFTQITDRRYILRPEAIESVWIMWRITGEKKWQDAAWRMFQAIEKVSRTDIAAAAIVDITVDPKDVKGQRMDSMESFWLAETLKYFYLCFEDFGVVSLNDYVLNTEAHPLRRPR